MIVFISDLHLTDGTSGETIKSGAFETFTGNLRDMAAKAKAENIEVVLLGDIFDVIRSDYWLQSGIRPWSDPTTDKDGNGQGLKDYTVEIVKKICQNPINIKSVAALKTFKDDMKEKGTDVKYTYIVGNHDWLLNRYPETRMQIANFLGIDNPKKYENEKFEAEKFWGNYKILARHGDIYDPFNFDGNRDASSLGDAIVIDLLNKFSRDVEKTIGAAADPALVKLLREVDNVRPLIDIPLWIQGACRVARTVEIAEQVKDVWNDLADKFFKIDFVKAHDKPWKIDVVDAMEIALKISKHLSFKDISFASLSLRNHLKTEDDYKDNAFNETYMKRNEAEYVLYGHTHHFRILPLDIEPMTGKPLWKTYFNTGTWRRIHVQTAYDTKSLEFLSWNVMTFIAFYLDSERKNRKYEVWNGALG